MTLLALVMVAAGALAAGDVPPPACDAAFADSTVAAAWEHYRAGRLERARAGFSLALERCPGHAGSRVGLGYVALRADDRQAARRWFAGVLDEQPDDVDALVGLGIVSWRDADLAGARDALARALALDPSQAEARTILERLPDDRRAARPRRRLPDTLEIAARAQGDRFEVGRDGRWEPFYVKGVNLGAALPGRYPSEFPA
ncbi:MAG TPA: tetratricopeptide repeat protein, partial [Gemmatimonadales bacterium]|nr:tetratricopeptide repeat protein [Gemmatimonadales bacterium]